MREWVGGNEAGEVCARLRWATVYHKKADKSKKQCNSTLISTPSFPTAVGVRGVAEVRWGSGCVPMIKECVDETQKVQIISSEFWGVTYSHAL